MEMSLDGSVMNSSNSSTRLIPEDPFRIALLTLYVIELLGGSVGICLMIRILKSNLQTITSIAVVNLLVVHLVFLLTVPFRIYYYAGGTWNLGLGFCKVVSGMIHVHMYIAFFFYVVILGARYYAFYTMVDQVQFYRKLHMVGASLVVWALGLVIGLPVIGLIYGTSGNATEGECFNFGKELQTSKAAAALNYLASVLVVVTTVALACCQALVLWRIFRQHGADTRARQEFGAQKKSLCFLLVLMLCFLPYHLFRFYYISHAAEFENINEVLLALTALSCLDTLIFLERNILCA